MTHERPLLPEELFTDRDYLTAQADEICTIAAAGYPAEVDPELADFMGALPETAMTSDEAFQSIHDVDEDGFVIDGSEGERS